MKFQITMKDPDTIFDSISDAVEKEIGNEGIYYDKHFESRHFENRRAEVVQFCETWFRYSEYVTIEIDTDANTATVIPVQR